jgi:MarR family transcriptional regulator for hemolysin
LAKQQLEVFAETLHLATHAWRNELDRRLRPLGLSRSKWMLLMTLARGAEGISQKALAEQLGIESPTLVGLLDRLERDALVERRAAKEDRRVKAVHLSPRGQALIGRIKEIAADLRTDLFTGIAQAELETALRVLAHLRSRAERLQ